MGCSFQGCHLSPSRNPLQPWFRNSFGGRLVGVPGSASGWKRLRYYSQRCKNARERNHALFDNNGRICVTNCHQHVQSEILDARTTACQQYPAQSTCKPLDDSFGITHLQGGLISALDCFVHSGLVEYELRELFHVKFAYQVEVGEIADNIRQSNQMVSVLRVSSSKLSAVGTKNTEPFSTRPRPKTRALLMHRCQDVALHRAKSISWYLEILKHLLDRLQQSDKDAFVPAEPIWVLLLAKQHDGRQTAFFDECQRLSIVRGQVRRPWPCDRFDDGTLRRSAHLNPASINSVRHRCI